VRGPGLDAVRAAVDRLPRVRLAHLPTPLEEAPRLSAALGGPRILVKRDDLTGLALGGNKTRMFEFVLAHALEQGADTVVAGAAVHSNYARQLAAACARLGLACHLVLRKTREDDDEVQGSLLLDLIVGAQVAIMDGDRDAQAEALRELATDLERQGRRVFLALIADEWSKWLQSAAYVSGYLELLDQATAAGIRIDRIYAATLEATHAGLLIGLLATNSATRLQAISPNEGSVWPGRTIEEEVARLANQVTANMGIALNVVPEDVNTTTAYAGRAYGAVTEDGLEAIRLFGRTEGLLLDPVYTAKGAAGLIDHVRRGRIAPDETIVFWHTGGAPAIFAYAPDLGFAPPGPPRRSQSTEGSS
jgi:1-aminocyclopropane-1-carboxylate deaminase/D-cysteine desulfhydrase-like pyridoxal-dependent ACC family enzyme